MNITKHVYTNIKIFILNKVKICYDIVIYWNIWWSRSYI